MKGEGVVGASAGRKESFLVVKSKSRGACACVFVDR